MRFIGSFPVPFDTLRELVWANENTKNVAELAEGG
jgi:hypothetical protein